MEAAGIGIDVGLSGAVAAVDATGASCKVYDIPTRRVGRKREYDLPAFDLLLRTLGHNLPAYVEKVGSRPGQGLASTFRFGEGYGIAQALVVAAGHRLTLVRPQTWKRIMLRDMGRDKGASCVRAIQLFPTAPLVGPRGGAKDGRAEALLMAELARRENLSNHHPEAN